LELSLGSATAIAAHRTCHVLTVAFFDIALYKLREIVRCVI